MHTQLDKSFTLQQMRAQDYDEKMVKVSYKDTETGEAMTYISKEDNGMMNRRLYITQPIGSPEPQGAAALERAMVQEFENYTAAQQMKK